jgi:hypothetical protein
MRYAILYRNQNWRYCLGILLACIGHAGCSAERQYTSETLPYSYVVHISKDYYIEVEGNTANLMRSDLDGIGGSVLIQVSHIAHEDSVIYGDGSAGGTKTYFIVNVIDNKVVRCADRGVWRRCLEEQWQLVPGQLYPPKQLAEGMTSLELQPWRYHRLAGALGFDDATWSAIVTFLPLPMTIVLAFTPLSLRSACSISVLLTLALGSLGQGVIGYGGPTLLAATTVWPIVNACLIKTIRAMFDSK